MRALLPYLPYALLLLGGIFQACLRVLSGMKNGAFYAKHDHPGTPLQPFVQNLHAIEAPAWYVRFLGYALPVAAVGLLLGCPWWAVLVAAYLLPQGASTAASYDYQKWINLGSGLPEVDPNENPKAEFAFVWRSKTYSWWYSRWWHGKRRRYLPLVGIVLMVGGAWLLYSTAAA